MPAVKKEVRNDRGRVMENGEMEADGAGGGRTVESGEKETDGVNRGGIGVAGPGGEVAGADQGVVERAGATDHSVSRSTVDSGGKNS